jgi:hypothetical protein
MPCSSATRLALPLALAACGGSSGVFAGSDAQSPLDLGAGQAIDAQCVHASFVPEAPTLATFVLMDQSTSMGDVVANDTTKWSAVAAAIAGFAQSSSSAGVEMGIQYFGLPASIGASGAVVDSCNVADYAKPDVEIGALPGNGSALVASLQAHGPSTTTPTQPALTGAIDHVRAWAERHPDQVPIVLLATDGEPYDCGSTVAGTEEVAAQGAAGTPPVLTFVVGIGEQGAALDGIAAAGGTGHAYYVDTRGAVSDEFRAALGAVRGSPQLSCTFAIPQAEAGAVDLTKVNVAFGETGSTAAARLIGQVAGPSSCSSEVAGWYFEPPDQPTNLQLCPATCRAAARQGSAASLQIVLGCKTEQTVPR